MPRCAGQPCTRGDSGAGHLGAAPDAPPGGLPMQVDCQDVSDEDSAREVGRGRPSAPAHPEAVAHAAGSNSSDDTNDVEVEELPIVIDSPSSDEGSGCGSGSRPTALAANQDFGELLCDIRNAAEGFWLRRRTRLGLLRRLAQEAARFAPHLRRKTLEYRTEMARKRLELLRQGDMEGHAKMVQDTREGHVQRILSETERIMANLQAPMALNMSEAVQQPLMLAHGRLLPHQLHGLHWLASLVDNNLSGILADDMGLGKTVEIMALIAHLAEYRAEFGPHLIVVPLSTVNHWVDEVKLWLPSLRCVLFHGREKARQALVEEMVRCENTVNIVITTYGMVVEHHGFFHRHPWFSLILDEGHKLKNINTQVCHACREVPCRHRFLLTGTPVQNSLRELWSLLKFVAPQSFRSLREFERWFEKAPPPPAQPGGGGGAEAPVLGGAAADEPLALFTEEEELLMIQRLHKILRPFLLRRTKDLVLAELPEKAEVVIWTPLSAWQEMLYRNGLRRVKGIANNPGRKSGVVMQTSMMLLRKALNHPYHFLSGKSDLAQNEDNLFRTSGKFELLDRILPRLRQFGHKVLIFAQMTSLLDLLEKLLVKLQIQFARLDGSKSLQARNEAVGAFRSDPKLGVLLLTTRAGGLGINLQVADTVILFDSDWNPQVDLQAVDRAHRLGQQRPVLVVRLMTPTSLDQGLLDRTCRKLDIERKVISAGRFHHDPGSEGQRCGMLRQLVHEARMALAMPAVIPSPTPLADISRMLARTPEELAAFEVADAGLLGPPAATDVGAPECTAAHLGRCGRLLTKSEISSVPVSARMPRKRCRSP